MGYSGNKTDQLFTARNLNGVYSEYDRKCALALAGKSHLFGYVANIFGFGYNVLPPTGVWYVFRAPSCDSSKSTVDSDSFTCDGLAFRLGDTGLGIVGIDSYRLNPNQKKVTTELEKLDSVIVDEIGKRVYVDRWQTPTETPSDCDVLSIHYSLELHTRVVNGKTYDVQLGHDPTLNWLPSIPARTSIVGVTFNSLTYQPFYPVGRIRNNEVALAEFAVEGVNLITIARTWKRFSCFRIHNCQPTELVVYLERPSGDSLRLVVEGFGCRSVRRKEDGEWLYSWSQVASGGATHNLSYFFPYLTGDVPYFSGILNHVSNLQRGSALALEISRVANNLATPFVALEWFRSLAGTLSPLGGMRDETGSYASTYRNPAGYDGEQELIGDCVLTWGRCLLGATSGDTRVIIIRNLGELIPRLNENGVAASRVNETLTLSSQTWDYIAPIDCNIFTKSGQGNNPTGVYGHVFQLYSTPTNYALNYPSFFLEGSVAPISQAWAIRKPHFYDSIDTLRRMISVQKNYTTTLSEPVSSELGLSNFVISPMGLSYFFNLPANYAPFSFPNWSNDWEVERADSLFTSSQGPTLLSPNNHLVSRHQGFLVDNTNTGSVYEWPQIFPTLAAPIHLNVAPAINTAYIPPGGPWGYSRCVDDSDMVLGYQSTTVTVFTFGSDWWQSKWGGPEGVDSTVRLPGHPEQTQQYAPEIPFDGVVQNSYLAKKDDVFFDLTLPRRACCISAKGHGVSYANDGITMTFPYDPTELGTFLPYVLGNDQGYFDVGSFTQRVPKTAWLWDVLNLYQQKWTRIIRRIVPELGAPVGPGQTVLNDIYFTAYPVIDNLGNYVFRLHYAGYLLLQELGVTVYLGTGPFIGDYLVEREVLADWLLRQSWSSYNLDYVDSATSFLSPLRHYGPSEFLENLTTMDVSTGQTYTLHTRFVDLG